MAHDRDDLIDRGRIGRVTTAFVRRDPAGVMAGHCRRRPRAAGGVQQLMSRHGSLLWRADRLPPALTEPGQNALGVHPALASSAAAAYSARCGSDATSPLVVPSGS